MTEAEIAARMFERSAISLGARTFEALMEDALRCACYQGGVPLCVRCECLFRLAVAATDYAYARVRRRTMHEEETP